MDSITGVARIMKIRLDKLDTELMFKCSVGMTVALSVAKALGVPIVWWAVFLPIGVMATICLVMFIVLALILSRIQ